MSTKPLKILILGGYGTFGGRLAQLLADDEQLTLLIAGRSKDKARIFCDQLPPGAVKIALRFERDGDVDGQLQQIQPDVLVDATGPFQSYGDDPYRVVKACIAHGIDYMDLADGSDFVRGIAQFDAIEWRRSREGSRPHPTRELDRTFCAQLQVTRASASRSCDKAAPDSDTH